MGKRLYVGNLPYQVDEDQLRALFEQDGRQVQEIKVVTDRETGRPRGFAFIEMATDAQAQAAVSTVNFVKQVGFKPTAADGGGDPANPESQGVGDVLLGENQPGIGKTDALIGDDGGEARRRQQLAPGSVQAPSTAV